MIFYRIWPLYTIFRDVIIVARAAYRALDRGCTPQQCTAALESVRAAAPNSAGKG